MTDQSVAAGYRVPQTSVARPSRHPAEVSVTFLRFTTVGMTAYQKGQSAGFLRPQAEDLQRRGAARIIPQAEPGAEGDKSAEKQRRAA